MTADDPDDSEPAAGDEPGRRERKRLETRERIAWTTIHLAKLHDGDLAKVHIKDIAEAAGVSHRTFHNHFRSREEAIASVAGDRARRIALTLRARPAGEPLRTAITEAVLEEYLHGREPDRDGMEQVRAVFKASGVSGELVKGMAAMEEEIAAAIAARAGLPDGDLYPRILAAAVASAARVVTEMWLRSATDTPYSVLLREAVSIAASMPPPDRHPPPAAF